MTILQFLTQQDAWFMSVCVTVAVTTAWYIADNY